jgi:hypothetical protein
MKYIFRILYYVISLFSTSLIFIYASQFLFMTWDPGSLNVIEVFISLITLITAFYFDTAYPRKMNIMDLVFAFFVPNLLLWIFFAISPAWHTGNRVPDISTVLVLIATIIIAFSLLVRFVKKYKK